MSAPALQAQLVAFAAHLRDPLACPAPPGIEDRRLQVYRGLLLDNVRELLGGNFPVIRRTLGEASWQRLARDFLANHRARTPLFPELGQEFLRFVQDRAAADAGDPPWLPELAHYEWVELALQLAEAALPPHDPQGDLLDGVPVVSPLAWPLAYAWPVQAIGPAHVPDTAPGTPTLLLVRRDVQGEVRFAALSPLVFRLLELLDTQTGTTGRQALAQLAHEAGAADPVAFMHDGSAMLRRLHAEGTLIGTR